MLSSVDWISAGSNVLGQALRGAPAAPAYSSAAGRVDQVFDNSGWVVTFGNENDVATDLRRESQRSESAGLTGLSGDVMTWLLIAAAGVLLWRKLSR